jgi:hypothetical protein
MKKSTSAVKTASAAIGTDYFESSWEVSWTYIKTVVDVVHEPVLILNKELLVMAANEPFYRTFKVSKKDTEHKLVYELGNGQWDIPALKKLLEDVLPKNTFFRGFEVMHTFPTIGKKVMLLNARQIYSNHAPEHSSPKAFPPIIMLAIEDITEIVSAAEALGRHTQKMEREIADRTNKMEIRVELLTREIYRLKSKKFPNQP